MKNLREVADSTIRRLQSRDAMWFEYQLQSKTRVRRRGAEIQILCPFHPDTSLGSFSVNTAKNGVWSCFSCGAHHRLGGSWNVLAEHLGMEKLQALTSDRATMTDRVARSLGSALPNTVRSRQGDDDDRGSSISAAKEKWPADEDWRGISGQLLSDLGCERVHDLEHGCTRIALPLRSSRGQLYGYTARALDPEVEPRYVPIAAPGRSHVPMKELLFLTEQAANWRTFMLVEGPVDALKLVDNGVPALATFGTGGWGESKLAVVISLQPDHVYVCMDNDSAGRRAQRAIVRDLRRAGVQATGLKLPKDVKDPGKLRKSQISAIKRRFF